MFLIVLKEGQRAWHVKKCLFFWGNKSLILKIQASGKVFVLPCVTKMVIFFFAAMKYFRMHFAFCEVQTGPKIALSMFFPAL